jgi:uncharacterized membrane protein YphA (DoxX/SURF4 family)
VSTLSTILAVVLGIAFAGSAIAKLSRQQKMVDEFERWGYQPAMMTTTGAVELLAAAMLLVGIAVNSLAIAGALLILVVMTGALWTHARVKDPVKDWLPAAVLLVLAFVLLVSMLP